MTKTLLRGGTLVLPDAVRRADLLIENGRIAAIGEALPEEGAAISDVSGCTVLPGLIETHTHLDLPVSGTVTADDFGTGTRAAILGGTTTLLDFATQDRGHTLREAYDTWQGRMEGRLHCDVGLHMAIVDWNAAIRAEMDAMRALGITSYKMYMAYPALMVEDDAIYDALRRSRELGAIIGFHCENGRLVGALTDTLHAQGRFDMPAHALSRPPAVEAEAIARLLRIAQLADAPVNIVHLSSAEGLKAVHDTRAPGQRVYIETCPQYLLLDDALLARPDGEKFICSPPLRRAEDIAALWQAIAGDEVYTIGTDHCSFDYATQKLAGHDDFARVPNGLPGVEHRLALLMQAGVAAGRMSLSQLARLLCENPARLFGMYPDKGILAPGSAADITVWDPERTWTIQAATQAQNVDYTPYEGAQINGGVRDVWLRGGLVVSDGALIGREKGQYVARKPVF